MLQVGAILQGRFALERVLGQGGMGAVYLARHLQLGGRLTAIKEMTLMSEDLQEQAAASELFRREAALLAGLDHPNLVRVSDFFEHDGRLYLVMEYIDGFTIDSVIAMCPTLLPVSVVLAWMEEACDVLDYLHTNDPPVIVRDLKPANIMLDARGRIRLIDFGIARLFTPNSATATFIKGAGTPGFAPMEQFGGTTDARSDIYSLGATLYCLLTRTAPPVATTRYTGQTPLEPPSAINPEVTADVDAVVLKMMAMRTKERYQRVRDARAAIQELRTQFPSGGTSQALNLNRVCEHCQSRALPLSTLCVRCGHPVPSPYGPEWPTTGVPTAAILDTERNGTVAAARPCDGCGIPVAPGAAECKGCGHPTGAQAVVAVPMTEIPVIPGQLAASEDPDTQATEVPAVAVSCARCGKLLHASAARCASCGTLVSAAASDVQHDAERPHPAVSAESLPLTADRAPPVAPATDSAAVTPVLISPAPGHVPGPVFKVLTACFLVVIGAGLAMLLTRYTHTVTLKMNVTPSGAEIFVDDMDKGPAPQSMELEAGRHTIQTRLPGYIPRSDTMDLESNDDITWLVEKSPGPSPTPSASDSAEPSPSAAIDAPSATASPSAAVTDPSASTGVDDGAQPPEASPSASSEPTAEPSTQAPSPPCPAPSL